MIHICIGCGEEFHRPDKRDRKYCSNQCQMDAKSRSILDRYLSNPSKETYYGEYGQVRCGIRNYFLRMNNYTCSRCGWDKRHPSDGKSTLELNHKDDDWKNCLIENIEVLCPNCHSLTYSYKGRNRGRGRAYRKQKEDG